MNPLSRGTMGGAHEREDQKTSSSVSEFLPLFDTWFCVCGYTKRISNFVM